MANYKKKKEPKERKPMSPPDLRHCIAQKSEQCKKANGNRSYSHFYKKSGYVIAESNIPICKDCLYEMTHDSEGNFVKTKFIKLLPMIDKPYIEIAFEQAEDAVARKVEKNANNSGNILGEYFRILMLSHVDKTFENSDANLHTMIQTTRNEKDPNDIDVTDDLRRKWGSWRENDAVRSLEYTYRVYDQFYEVDSDPITRSIVMDICATDWEISQARMNGGATDKLIKSRQDLLGSANMKPVQTKNKNSGFTVGGLVKHIEEDDPIIKPIDEFKDPDNINKYFTKYFNHVLKMFGRQ